MQSLSVYLQKPRVASPAEANAHKVRDYVAHLSKNYPIYDRTKVSELPLDKLRQIFNTLGSLQEQSRKLETAVGQDQFLDVISNELSKSRFDTLVEALRLSSNSPVIKGEDAVLNKLAKTCIHLNNESQLKQALELVQDSPENTALYNQLIQAINRERQLEVDQETLRQNRAARVIQQQFRDYQFENAVSTFRKKRAARVIQQKFKSIVDKKIEIREKQPTQAESKEEGIKIRCNDHIPDFFNSYPDTVSIWNDVTETKGIDLNDKDRMLKIFASRLAKKYDANLVTKLTMIKEILGQTNISDEEKTRNINSCISHCAKKLKDISPNNENLINDLMLLSEDNETLGVVLKHFSRVFQNKAMKNALLKNVDQLPLTTIEQLMDTDESYIQLFAVESTFNRLLEAKKDEHHFELSLKFLGKFVQFIDFNASNPSDKLKHPLFQADSLNQFCSKARQSDDPELLIILAASIKTISYYSKNRPTLCTQDTADFIQHGLNLKNGNLSAILVMLSNDLLLSDLRAENPIANISNFDENVKLLLGIEDKNEAILISLLSIYNNLFPLAKSDTFPETLRNGTVLKRLESLLNSQQPNLALNASKAMNALTFKMGEDPFFEHFSSHCDATVVVNAFKKSNDADLTASLYQTLAAVILVYSKHNIELSSKVTSVDPNKLWDPKTFRTNMTNMINAGSASIPYNRVLAKRVDINKLMEVTNDCEDAPTVANAFMLISNNIADCERSEDELLVLLKHEGLCTPRPELDHKVREKQLSCIFHALKKLPTVIDSNGMRCPKILPKSPVNFTELIKAAANSSERDSLEAVKVLNTHPELYFSCKQDGLDTNQLAKSVITLYTNSIKNENPSNKKVHSIESILAFIFTELSHNDNNDWFFTCEDIQPFIEELCTKEFWNNSNDYRYGIFESNIQNINEETTLVFAYKTLQALLEAKQPPQYFGTRTNIGQSIAKSRKSKNPEIRKMAESLHQTINEKYMISVGSTKLAAFNEACSNFNIDFKNVAAADNIDTAIKNIVTLAEDSRVNIPWSTLIIRDPSFLKNCLSLLINPITSTACHNMLTKIMVLDDENIQQIVTLHEYQVKTTPTTPSITIMLLCDLLANPAVQLNASNSELIGRMLIDEFNKVRTDPSKNFENVRLVIEKIKNLSPRVHINIPWNMLIKEDQHFLNNCRDLLGNPMISTDCNDMLIYILELDKENIQLILKFSESLPTMFAANLLYGLLTNPAVKLDDSDIELIRNKLLSTIPSASDEKPCLDAEEHLCADQHLTYLKELPQLNQELAHKLITKELCDAIFKKASRELEQVYKYINDNEDDDDDDDEYGDGWKEEHTDELIAIHNASSSILELKEFMNACSQHPQRKGLFNQASFNEYLTLVQDNDYDALDFIIPDVLSTDTIDKEIYDLRQLAKTYACET